MEKINYSELQRYYNKIYEFLSNHDMVNIAEQRYDLGDGEYVNVESYDTVRFEDRKYESHKKYFDIQYIIIGRENIVVEPVSELSVSEKYDENKDIVFYKNNVCGIDNFLEEGEMLLLNPEDGHMPCISIDKTVHVKKAVFKLLVNK